MARHQRAASLAPGVDPYREWIDRWRLARRSVWPRRHLAFARVRPMTARWAAWGEIALLGLVALASLALRLPDLAVPNDNYDEGVYLESLLLMRRGFRPFHDIVATQGPLHLQLAYLSYALGGYTLAAARMGSVIASLVSLGGVTWSARLLGGPIAGLTAALLLGLSPTFLTVSRQALPEPLAIALTTVAIAAGLQGRLSNPARWNVLAGLALGSALMVKPVVLPVGLALLVLMSGRHWLRRSLTLAVPVATVSLCVLIVVGSASALEEVVGWRLSGGQVDPSSLAHNAALLYDKLFRQEQPAFYLLALTGFGALLVRTRTVGLALGAWALAQLLALLLYSDLSSHLGATLIAPLAVLGGCGAAAAARLLGRKSRASLSIVAAAALGWYVMVLPAIVGRDLRLISGGLTTLRNVDQDTLEAVRVIQSLTDEDDYLLTDSPYLAFLADRLVPPRMVDPSESRLRTGALSEDEIRSHLDEYDPDLVILWTGSSAESRRSLWPSTRISSWPRPSETRMAAVAGRSSASAWPTTPTTSPGSLKLAGRSGRHARQGPRW